jgi:hypothetical protein
MEHSEERQSKETFGGTMLLEFDLEGLGVSTLRPIALCTESS